MSRIIEFKLDDTAQATVLVEADDSIPAEGQTRVSAGGILTEQARLSTLPWTAFGRLPARSRDMWWTL